MLKSRVAAPAPTEANSHFLALAQNHFDLESVSTDFRYVDMLKERLCARLFWTPIS